METDPFSSRRQRVDPQPQAPVEQVDLAEAADHHVLGLDVAVDDAAAVSEVQRVGDLAQHLDLGRESIPVTSLELAPRRVRLVQDEVSQRGALHALHHQKRRASLVEREHVDGNDVRVLERASDPSLGDERARRHGRADVLSQALHRDIPVERRRPRHPHDPHPALPERRAEHDLGGARRARRRRRRPRHGEVRQRQAGRPGRLLFRRSGGARQREDAATQRPAHGQLEAIERQRLCERLEGGAVHRRDGSPPRPGGAPPRARCALAGADGYRRAGAPSPRRAAIGCRSRRTRPRRSRRACPRSSSSRPRERRSRRRRRRRSGPPARRRRAPCRRRPRAAGSCR